MKKIISLIVILLLVSFDIVADNDVEMGSDYYKRVIAKYINELENDKAGFENKLQGFFDSTAQQLGFGLSYHAASPAQNLKLGENMPTIDLGLELALLKVDTSHEFWQFIIADKKIPPVLVIPRLHVNIALPADFEFGVSGAKIPYSNIWLIGGELKWSVIGNHESFFNLAIRGAFSKLIGLDELSIGSVEGNISGSFDLKVIIPYFGLGAVDIMADATVPEVPEGFASNVADYMGLNCSGLTGQEKSFCETERNKVITRVNNVFPEKNPDGTKARFFNLKKYNHVVPKMFVGVKFDLLYINFVTELALSYDFATSQYINTFFTFRANLSF